MYLAFIMLVRWPLLETQSSMKSCIMVSVGSLLPAAKFSADQPLSSVYVAILEDMVLPFEPVWLSVLAAALSRQISLDARKSASFHASAYTAVKLLM